MRRSPFAVEFAIALVLALIALVVTAGPATLVILIAIVLVGLGVSFLPRVIGERLRRRRAR